MLKHICFISVFALSACGTTPPVQKVVDVPTLVYPNLPPVAPVPNPTFLPVQFELPKDANGNIETYDACVNTLTTTSTTKCSANSTNVYIGMDQADYTHLLIDLQSMRNYASEQQARIIQENIQRAEWQKQNTPAVSTK
jgi:hypothetical protein